MRNSISLLVCAAIFSALLIGCGGGGGNTTAPPSQDAAAPTDCSPGAKQCKGKIPETCNADGAWQDGTVCEYGCTNGICSGECQSGDKRCQGKTPQTCGTDATWQDGTICPYVCQNGICSGECVPDDQRCAGLVPQICDVNGAWQDGTACEYGCTNGACNGSCAPGSLQCIGRTPETCDATGIWRDEAICPYVCRNGICSGECVPDTKQCNGLVPQICDVNGAWQDGTACEYTCLNGQCAGVCVPGSIQCKGLIQEACDANAIWQDGTICPYLCQNGVCSGECVPGDQRCTGLVPQTCSAAGAWQDGTACLFVCQDGDCTGVCTPGDKQCDGNTAKVCDTTGQWDDTICSSACCHGACTTPLAELSISRYHACARKNDGTVWCWGLTDGGLLGDGKNDGQPCGTAPQTCKVDPVQVAALGTTTVQLSTGYTHTCALKNDGTVWCWGNDYYGADEDHLTPIQALSLGSDTVEISAGASFTCARKNDGTLWCWGLGSQGQLGYGLKPTKKTSPVQVAALGTNVVQVSNGNSHACARKNDGTLWCWGDNNFGQLGDGTATGENCGTAYVCKPSPVQVTTLGTNVIDVIAGTWSTCARKNDGTVWCWGSCNDGELGNGSTIGTACYGTCIPSPVQVTTLGTNAESMASNNHSCVIKDDTSVWCWGYNPFGELGNGTTANQSLPVPASVFNGGATQIAVGPFDTCARKNDGSFWCWGLNDFGQLGNGTLDNQLSPTLAMCQ